MEKSFVFDAVLVDGVYDRQYLSSDFCNYFGSFISNGVFPTPSNNLQVTASNNFDVAVLAGRAFINGRTYHNTDKLLFTLDVADGVLNRIDTVVVQVNHLAREIKTVIKKGTFAVNPIPPELTNNADYEEIQLAQIYIKAGAINITQADITDTRLDKSVCGVVSQMVQTVDTTTLFNQYKSWYEQTTGKAIKDITVFEVQFKADTIAWLNGLKEVLDKNTAANLLNLINELKSTTYTKSETDLTRTYTLTHSKSGAVHTLTGLPATNGIYQCQFRATADYAEGETFADGYTAKPNGEETKLPDKAFISGDIVSVTVDVGGKKLGFKIGGGGGYGTLSPQIRNFTAKAGNHEITLNWNNPSDSNFAGLYLVRKQGSAPQKLTDGKKIDVGKATSYTDNEPENGKLYYYRAFTYNQKKQVQTELTGAVVNATPKAGIPLKDLPVGTLVKSNIGSSSQNMIVIQKSKPSSMYSETCNGIWLLTQNIIELKQWNDTNYNVYSTSTINSYLNGDFLNSLDSELKKYISTVKIPFIDGVGGAQIKTGENGLLCKVFLLCGYEAGISTSDHSDLPIDGSKCSYFDSGDGSSAILKRNALYNGVGTDWYYRTAGTYGDNYVWGAGYNNKARNLSCDANNVGIRPTFIVNNECLVNPVQNSDGSYTIV